MATIGNTEQPVTISPIVTEANTATSLQPEMSVAMETYFDHKRQSGEWKGRHLLAYHQEHL